MTPPPLAKLAFVTQPDADTLLLNLQFDAGQDRVCDVTTSGARFERVRITPDQLRNIVADGAKMMVGS